jgi:hypothetical protein
MSKEAVLDGVLAEQPWLGRMVWDRGSEGKLVCRARMLQATICFRRSGEAKVKLTRFGGQAMIGEKGKHNAKITSALSTRIPPAHH